MRKTLLLLLILLATSTCYGQLTIKYGSKATFKEDTVRTGDTLHVSYNIVNTSTDLSTLKGPITTHLSTSKTTDSLSIATTKSQVVNVLPGDSVTINAPFLVTAGTIFFKKGDTCIVVVWPTGVGTENLIGKRKIAKALFVDYDLSVKGSEFDLNRVSLFPNPVRAQATIKLTSNRSVIDNVTIVNMQGQEMPQPVLRNGQMDLGYLHGGVYILKLHFTDGAVSVFRIIKQ